MGLTKADLILFINFLLAAFITVYFLELSIKAVEYMDLMKLPETFQAYFPVYLAMLGINVLILLIIYNTIIYSIKNYKTICDNKIAFIKHIFLDNDSGFMGVVILLGLFFINFVERFFNVSMLVQPLTFEAKIAYNVLFGLVFVGCLVKTKQMRDKLSHL